MNNQIPLSLATVIVVRSLRPDWDHAGIESAIQEALDQGNPPPDIVRALTAAALTPKVRTPRGFLYARDLWATHTPAFNTKTPECEVHPTFPAHDCGPCKYEHLNPSDTTDQHRPRGTPMPPEIKAQINANRKRRQTPTQQFPAPETATHERQDT